jgi:hypothetical protein
MVHFFLILFLAGFGYLSIPTDHRASQPRFGLVPPLVPITAHARQLLVRSLVPVYVS